MGTRSQSNTTLFLGLLHSLKAEGVSILLIKATFLLNSLPGPFKHKTR